MENLPKNFSPTSFIFSGGAGALVNLGTFHAFLYFLSGSANILLLSAAADGSTLLLLFAYVYFHYVKTNGAPQTGPTLSIFLFSLLAVLFSSSIFSFSMHLAGPEVLGASPLFLNSAKLIGFLLLYLLFLLTAWFEIVGGDAVKRVPFEQVFLEKTRTKPFFPVSFLLILALVLRLAYLQITTAVYGDAVHYANIGYGIANGEITSINPFWMNLYCFWESFLFLFTENKVAGAITSSLIPGTLLVLPVYWIGTLLFNRKTGSIAALVTAFHPRLITFSGNGYSEMFYLFFAALGAAFLVAALKNPLKWRYSFAFGLAFGVYIAVRNEAFLFYLLLLPLFFFKERPFKNLSFAIAGCLLILISYVSLSEMILDHPGMGQKSVNLAKVHSEQLNQKEAAREIYSPEGLAFSKNPEVSLFDALPNLFRRLPSNLMYLFERVPGVLLTPLFLFAFFLPLAVRCRKEKWIESLPLLLMLLFPLLFFTFTQIEPRYLFLILVPVHIFGSAGLLAVSNTLPGKAGQVLTGFILTITIALSLIIAAARGWTLEKEYQVHRDLAEWLKNHVPVNQTIAGSGYGYISTTAFLSGHQAVSHIWAENPKELAQDLQQREVSWLILYEPFVRIGNAELLNVLDEEIPEMVRKIEVKDRNRQRYQIFKLKEE